MRWERVTLPYFSAESDVAYEVVLSIHVSQRESLYHGTPSRQLQPDTAALPIDNPPDVYLLAKDDRFRHSDTAGKHTCFFAGPPEHDPAFFASPSMRAAVEVVGRQHEILRGLICTPAGT
jgi:hypothetical protein